MNAIELNKLIREGKKFNIFDVRNNVKYNDFHLEGAINIEKGAILEKPDKYMNKEEQYYITCNGGNSATMIAKNLSVQGYKLESLEGGMNRLLSNQ